MKYYRLESPIEQTLQDVESFCREKGIKIDFCENNGTSISLNGKFMGYLREIEGGSNVTSFPREIESERIVLPED